MELKETKADRKLNSMFKNILKNEWCNCVDEVEDEYEKY